MAFENWPYSDYHDLNLDWVLRKTKEAITDAKNAITTAADALKYAETYFDSPEFSEMVGNILERMATDGTLEDIITQKLVNYYNFAGQKGWRNNVNDGVIYSDQTFVKAVTGESLLVNNNVLAYVGNNTFELPLDMPITRLSANVSLDSYLGTGVNVNVVNNASLRVRPLFFDKSINQQTKNIAMLCSVSGTHATPPDAPKNAVGAKAAEVVQIADSYYQARLNGRRWAYGSNFVTNSNNNVVNNANGEARMECDTLISLVLMGINYTESPYANNTPNLTYDFNNLTVNPSGNYTWALPWKINDVFGRKITYTGAQNWYFWRNGLVFKDRNRIANGDIAIFTKPPIQYFDHIRHIGIIKMVNDGGMLVPYVYHVTGLSGVPSPMMYEPLADVLAREKMTYNDNLYFARPSYT